MPCDNSLVILPAPPRLPPTSGRAPPAADHRNRRSGELQGSKITGEVVHNRASRVELDCHQQSADIGRYRRHLFNTHNDILTRQSVVQLVVQQVHNKWSLGVRLTREPTLVVREARSDERRDDVDDTAPRSVVRYDDRLSLLTRRRVASPSPSFRHVAVVTSSSRYRGRCWGRV